MPHHDGIGPVFYWSLDAVKKQKGNRFVESMGEDDENEKYDSDDIDVFEN